MINDSAFESGFIVDGEAHVTGPIFAMSEGTSAACEGSGFDPGTPIIVVRKGEIVYSGPLTRFERLSWRDPVEEGELKTGLAALIKGFNLEIGDTILPAPKAAA